MEEKMFSELSIVKTKPSNNIFGTEYYFEHDSSLKDGSLIIYIIKNYGLRKLKEVLNFHKIKHTNNLIQHELDNDINFIEQTIEKYFPATWRWSENNFYSLNKYNPVIEYFILNEDPDAIKFIIDECLYNPRKRIEIWDYLNGSAKYQFEKDSSQKDNILGTIFRILWSNTDKNIIDKCAFIMNNLDPDYFIAKMDHSIIWLFAKTLYIKTNFVDKDVFQPFVNDFLSIMQCSEIKIPHHDIVLKKI